MKWDANTLKRRQEVLNFERINVGDIIYYGDCDLEVIESEYDGINQSKFKTRWTGYCSGQYETPHYSNIDRLIFTNSGRAVYAFYSPKSCTKLPCYDSDCDCVYDVVG